MNAPANKKPFTAPVPPRAMLDDLTQLDLRVLIKVCAHDRMSVHKTGQGCLVSSKSIALALGVHHTSVSTSLSRLKDAGYIVHEKRADGDKRGRTYRVIYTEADELAVRNEGNVPPKSSLPLGETNSEKSFLQNGKVVSRDFENGDNFQCDANYKYKEGKHSDKSGRYSDKSARLQRGAMHETTTETAEFLRLLERDINGGMIGYPDAELEPFSSWLLETYEHFYGENDRISQWANRLHDEINVVIEERQERRLFADGLNFSGV